MVLFSTAAVLRYVGVEIFFSKGFFVFLFVFNSTSGLTYILIHDPFYFLIWDCDGDWYVVYLMHFTIAYLFTVQNRDNQLSFI